MLIKCPECNLQVSDKAVSCPHCGYPIKSDKKQKSIRLTKRRRLPNGFGQISKIKSENLKRPYRAMITIGYTDAGKPICRTLKPNAYFSTYNEAYEALIKYNQRPYTLDSDITLRQLYDIWFEGYRKSGLKEQTIASVASCFKHCEPLYDYKINTIEPFVIKETLEKIGKRTMVFKSKTLLGMIFDYAMENGMIKSNPAKEFKFSRMKTAEYARTEKCHIDFTNDEMDILWANKDKSSVVQMILIQIYMGWRPRELCELAVSNIDLGKQFIIGGMKTKAGTNRSVPIHSKIYDMIRGQYERAISVKSSRLFYLLDSDGKIKEYTYRVYENEFANTMKYLGISLRHRPHDCRVQFITMCKRNNVDEYAIKYMAGHSISDITESVYTKRGVLWLKNEIEKIKE